MTIQLIPPGPCGEMEPYVCLKAPVGAYGRAAPFGNPLDGFARGEHHPFPSARQTNAIPLNESLRSDTH